MHRFSRDDEATLHSVLADLVSSGLVEREGSDGAQRLQATRARGDSDPATGPAVRSRLFIQIGETPTAYPMVDGELRRFLLERFPYAMLYSIGATCVRVTAVAHQHRKPGYWRADDGCEGIR